MTFDTENHKNIILALFNGAGFKGAGLEEACVLKQALIDATVHTGEKPKKSQVA